MNRSRFLLLVLSHVRPTPVSVPDQHEIQVYPGNGPVEVIKCQEGGTCAPRKVMHRAKP
jgi:hypothetical protein